MPKSVSNHHHPQVTPEPALEKRTRRYFSLGYKLRIITLESSVELRKSAHPLGAPRRLKNPQLMLLGSCLRKISASMHKTNKVNRAFLSSLCTLMGYTSFPHSTDDARFTQANACKHGELGALLRKEKLYSNQLAQW